MASVETAEEVSAHYFWDREASRESNSRSLELLNCVFGLHICIF